jgi:hypothetical protein
MIHPIGRQELWHAQATLLLAIALQLVIATDLRVGSKYLIAVLELLLVGGLWLTAPRRHQTHGHLNRTIALLLIGLVSFANGGALVLLINALISGSQIPGHDLLLSAFAIFITNIIMFGLWFWELDSPGLSGLHRTDKNTHFQFPQPQSSSGGWRPTFFDYLYISITNSTAFSPTDTLPLTHIAKSLMSVQALIALLTVVLVTARAVNILG